MRSSTSKHSKKKTAHSAGGSKTLILIVIVLLLAAAAAGFSFGKGSAVTDGNHPLVRTARAQLGNAGGEEFWTWYGFEEWVDWCGCFVSW